MSERDYKEIKKYFIYGIIGLIIAALTGMGSMWYINIGQNATNKEKIRVAEEKIIKLETDINRKADVTQVLQLKQDMGQQIKDNYISLSKQIDDNYKGLSEQIQIVIKMRLLSTTNYNYKTKETNQ